MADTHRNRYVRGDYLADCDSCGFTFLASQLQRRWDGFMVCDKDYEERHPSDLFRISRTDRPVPWTRPPKNLVVDVPGWTETVVDGSPKIVTFGPVDPDSL